MFIGIGLLGLPQHHAIAQDDTAAPFASATDAQIKEAQRYYRYCSENETLNAQKDCKCAATRFLDTRLALGDDATPKDIIAANINACLKDEKRTQVKGYTDLSDVTDKQLEEAETVLAECKADAKMSRDLDCECVAASVLDERIKQGPIPHRKHLIFDIHHQCKNVVGLTGYQYSECMISGYAKQQGVAPKDFCECYARRWGELFSNFEGRTTSGYRRAMRSSALRTCRQPEAYAPKPNMTQ